MKQFTRIVLTIIFSVITSGIFCSLPIDPFENPANTSIRLFVNNRISDGPLTVNQGDSADIGLIMFLPKNLQNVTFSSSCNMYNNTISIDSKSTLDTVHFSIRFNSAGACTLFVNGMMNNIQYKDRTDTLPFIIKFSQPTTVLSPSTVDAPPTIIAGIADTLLFSADNRNRPNPLRLELINAGELTPSFFTVLRSGPDTILIAIAATTAATTSPVKIGIKTSDGVQSDTSWYPISFIDQKDALWSQVTVAVNAIEGKPVIFDLRPYLVKPQNDIIGISTNLGVVASDTTWQWTPAWGCEATASAIIVAKEGDASQELKLSITIAEGDTTKPSIRLMNEALNGKKVSSPQITVECIVKDDESGVGKVTMSRGNQGTDASMQKDSIYSALITGLSNGQSTEITISASDKSRRKNSASLVFTVTYDSTMSDEEAPAIVQSSGPESGGRVLDASGALSFTITDPSGLDSVWWSLNAVPAGKLNKQADGNYAISYTLKTFGANTITIFAKDASTNHNMGGKEVALTYNTKPSEIVLSTPANNAIDIDTLPTFTWNGGKDMDGDPVVFKVLYGQAATSLSSSTVEVKENKATLAAANKLLKATTYFWQVIGVSSSKAYPDTVKSAINAFKTIMGIGPQITVQPKAAISVNEGDMLKISVDAKGDPTPTYQWYKDDSPVSGQTSAEFSKSNVTADDAGTYYVKVSNGIGDGVISTKAVVTVHSKPTITEDPSAVTVKEGESAAFSVKASGEGTLTYQWLKDGQTIAWANAATYTINATTLADDQKKFSCIVSNTVGRDTSEVAVLTVTPKPEFTVTFDVDGGTPSISPKKVKEGEKVTQPTAPTKTGYAFDGWYSSAGTKFDFNTAITTDITITVKWAKVYSVTYNDNYATTHNAPVDSKTYKTGDKASVIAPPSKMTKDGYICIGWCTDIKGNSTLYKGGEQITIGNSDIVLYAQWKRNQCTVTFNADNGTASQKVTVNEGSSLGSKFPQQDPTKTGYTFKGWFNGNNQFTDITIVNNTITVTAKWEANKYTVKFTSEIMPMGNGVGGSKTYTVDYGDPLPTPIPELSDGQEDWVWMDRGDTINICTYYGWYTSEIGGTYIAPSSKVATDLDLYTHVDCRKPWE